ncbi:calcium channel flower-like [Dendronephthya gigantea]|uniref:calcium channel flower-like n=1 Tax=Dendronephthya gigantea TaxID=151771 RepID=UPI00106A9827|nr:calcium channel flower-like [Dendronephthya gigantea]
MANGESGEVPGAIRLMVKVWGAFSALLSIGFGVFVMITVTPICLAAGAIMVTSGLVILTFEAPVLCFKIEAIAKLSKWIEEHLKFWIRAFIYFCFALLPFLMCRELSTFIGSGAVMVTAALYGVMAIGRKGQGPSGSKSNDDDVEMKESLVDSQGDPKELGSPS